MSVITTPFSWLLLQFYYLFSNYGIALIAFSVVIGLIRIPFDIRSKSSSMKVSLLSPHIERLKEKHGENTPKYNEEVQKLYKQEGVNLMSGCLWTLIPLAIVLILYQVVRYPLEHIMGLTEDQIAKVISTLESLGVDKIDTSNAWYQIYVAEYITKFYDQVKVVVPEVINLNFDFFGIGLGSVPSFQIWKIADWGREQIMLFFLPVLSAGLSVVSQKLTTSMSFQDQTQNMGGTMKTMMIIGPIMSLWIGYSFPAAMSIYWLGSNVVSMVSNFFINRNMKKRYEQLTRERDEKIKQKDAELEAKRRETERLKALNLMAENPNTSKKNKKKLEKQKQEERQVADKKKGKKDIDPEEEPSRVGNRRYARGRAYVPDRFSEGYQPSEETGITNETDSYETPDALNELGSKMDKSTENDSGYDGTAEEHSEYQDDIHNECEGDEDKE